jgi:HK97 family phage prohead protease
VRETLSFDGLTAETFSVDQERRTMRGVVVPWNRLGRHGNGNAWRFTADSTVFGHAKYIRLNDEHVTAMKLGRATSAESTPAGLVMTFKVYDGPAGDKALAAALAGKKTGLSVEVDIDDADTAPDPDHPGATLVNMANLTGVAFTANPAFTDARLISVAANEKGSGMPEEITTEETPAEVKPDATQAADEALTPALFKEMFSQLMAKYKPEATPRPVVNPTGARPAVQVTEPAPYAFSRTGPAMYNFSGATEHDFSRDLFSVIAAQLERRDPGAARDRLDGFIRQTFADVEIADVPGTRVPQVRPDMWVPQRDYNTPLWDMVGRGPIDGMPFYVPKFTSASGLVVAATEKVEPAGGSFVDELQTITPGQLWGKVEITRQLWRTQGTPALSGILWEQMLREFYEDREAAIATFLNTLTAAADITITAGAATNDEKQLRTAQFEAALAALNFVRGGNRFRGFAVQQDLYTMFASTEDDAGRPKYPILNPSNANGTSESGFSTMNIAGTRAVPSWALAAGGQTTAANSWLFDPAVVMSWAGAPERLFWDFGATVQTANIPQLSFVTVGLYADYANANTDISGVRQVIWDPVA